MRAQLVFAQKHRGAEVTAATARRPPAKMSTPGNQTLEGRAPSRPILHLSKCKVGARNKKTKRPQP